MKIRGIAKLSSTQSQLRLALVPADPPTHPGRPGNSENILGQKLVNVQWNVSDDGDKFKKTKLLLYIRIENHGYVTKTDIT